MKGLIFNFGFLFILLVTSCNGKTSSQKIDLTEESQIFLPVINEFYEDKAAAITPTHIPSITATRKSRQTTEQVVSKTPAITAIPTIKNSEKKSNIIPFEPLFQIPIPIGYTQEIDKTYRYGTTQAGSRIPHDGVEFYNASGTPVIASGDGAVFFAGSDDQTSFGQFKEFYGNLVIVEHQTADIPYPIFSLYAHLSSINVNTGDQIKLGEKIGEVGASGSAIGSHLHFEVRINRPNLDDRINPELLLALIENPPGTQSGILVGRILDEHEKNIPQNNLVIQLIENGQISTNKIYYLETYAANVPSDPQWGENFVIGNLPIGHYRISTFIENRFVEKYFDIVNDSLTDITLSVNN
jgi:hypothetical protein